MNYPYECEKCEYQGDVDKSMKDATRTEHCPQCGNPMERVWTRTQIIGAKVQNAEYNPALGCVTKSAYHRAEVAKKKGLIEVGNDYGSGEKLQQKFETDRREKRERVWNED